MKLTIVKGFDALKKQGQISGLGVTKLLRLESRSRRTDAHQKAHRWQRSRTRPVAGRLALLESCGFDALFDLRKSIRIGVVQFYRHRQEPVPWIGRSKNGRLFRRPRTTNERRAQYSNEATEEILVSHGFAFKLRQERESAAQRS